MTVKDTYDALSDNIGASKLAKPGQGGVKFYIAQSAALIPGAQVFPENANDVSAVISAARNHLTPFAVKAGGHGIYAGASSIQGGLLIDLSRLNQVEVSSDRKSVFIGAGAKWGDVYAKLDAIGLSVPGGRISIVGVGGLTLGGGISFAANRFGLACDNVKSFEVVLASGEIVSASREIRADLFWALRGAGTNFGIVTRFEFVAFEQGQVWGGVKQYLEDFETQAISLLDRFCHNQAPNSDKADIYAEAFIIIVYIAPMGKFITTTVLSHDKPADDPPVFNEFNKLLSIGSTTKVRSIADLSIELDANNPHGLRCKTLGLAVKSDVTVLTEVVSIYKEVILPHKDSVQGFVPAILLQPLLPRMLPGNGRDNTLGIHRADGPLHQLPQCSASLQHVRAYLAKKLAVLPQELQDSTHAEIEHMVEALTREPEMQYAAGTTCDPSLPESQVDARPGIGFVHETATNTPRGWDSQQVSLASFEQLDLISCEDTSMSFELSDNEMFLSSHGLLENRFFLA